jgi:peptide/nickel transport system substrate-binding protein
MRLVACALLALGVAFPSIGHGQETPQRGGILVQSMDVEPASLDPAFGNAPARDRVVYTQIFENLFAQDEKGHFVPQLATSWEIAPDQLSITFHLREGVVFHDGTPFNADAVAFNLNRLVDPKVKARARQFVTDLKSATVIDNMTVRVDFVGPSASVLAGLANEAGMMSSPKAVQSLGSEYGRHPVGTGPFAFDSWTSGNEIKVKRFDQYWGRDEKGQPLPYLDGVTNRIIVDTASKIIEARAGTVQITDAIRPKDYAQVQQDPNLTLEDSLVSNIQILSFNLTRPPFNDERLRRAFVHGINRTLIEKVASGGQGLVMKGLEPPQSPIYGENLRDYDFDVAKAKKFLEDSGFKGTVKLSIIQRDPDTQIAQVIQAQMAAVGVRVEIESLERLAWGDKIYGHNYDIALHRMTAPKVDPDVNFGAYYARTAGANHSGHSDEKIFELIERGRTTLDPAARKAIYVEFQQYLLDHAYQLPLTSVRDRGIVSKKVAGLHQEFSGAWLFDRAWLRR